MISTIYFWKGETVHKYIGDSDSDTVCETEFIGCFAIDTECTLDMRYGKYFKKAGWKHVPIEQFPKKFRIHLLLLGVT